MVPSLDMRKGDVRIPLKPLKSESVQTDLLQQCYGLTRPLGIVQFVEGDHSAAGHSWQKRLESGLGWLIQVCVKEQKTDDQVRMIAQEVGRRPNDIALDQMSFRNVPEESVLVMQLQQGD
jgi:hypothetical protein